MLAAFFCCTAKLDDNGFDDLAYADSDGRSVPNTYKAIVESRRRPRLHTTRCRPLPHGSAPRVVIANVPGAQVAAKVEQCGATWRIRWKFMITCSSTAQNHVSVLHELFSTCCPRPSLKPIDNIYVRVTSPAAEHHRPLAGTKLYCLVTEAHRCKQLA